MEEDGVLDIEVEVEEEMKLCSRLSMLTFDASGIASKSSWCLCSLFSYVFAVEIGELGDHMDPR